MAKGVTYTAIDSKGTVHTRYSAGHVEPRYTHAVVRVPGCDAKQFISYASSERLANASYADAMRWKCHDAELVAVTAVAGRQKKAA